MKHEEKKKDEGPKFDERGEPLVIFKRTCPAMNNADLAARASFFAAMRAMSDEDFKAGRGLTFQTMVREDPRYPARQDSVRFRHPSADGAHLCGDGG